jgi:dihydrodiol dehydrogenase / D-xylose 1-dehydrogenase (NADP)
MAALRWGICSAGKISHDFVIGLKVLPESSHTVVAVAARSLDSAQSFATTHCIPRAYGTYQELANDPQVDVVYIGTIHPTHAACTKLMMDAGKPVVCEKPLTMNAKDTKELIQLAKDKNLFFLEGVWMRFFPVMVELRRLLSEDAIGTVRYVNVTFGFRMVSEVKRLTQPDLGGGATLDIGVYVVNFATMIFNGEKPIKIHAEGVLSEEGVDLIGAVTLTYTGGRIAQLTFSIVTDLPCEALVSGTKGDITVPKRFWCPTMLKTSEGTKEYPLPEPYMPTVFANSQGFCYEAEEVRQCLQEGKKESSIQSLNDTVVVAEIMDEIMKQIGVVYFNK